MTKTKRILKSFHIEKWIGNLLIFIPLLMSKSFFSTKIFNTIVSFFCFSFITSAIFSFSDLRNEVVEKKYRKDVIILMLILFFLALCCNFISAFDNVISYLIIFTYIMASIIYILTNEEICFENILILIGLAFSKFYYGAIVAWVPVDLLVYLIMLGFSLLLTFTHEAKHYENIQNNNPKITKLLNILIYFSVIFISGLYAIWSFQKYIILLATLPILVLSLFRYAIIKKNIYYDKILLLLTFVFSTLFLMIYL